MLRSHILHYTSACVNETTRFSVISQRLDRVNIWSIHGPFLSTEKLRSRRIVAQYHYSNSFTSIESEKFPFVRMGGKAKDDLGCCCLCCCCCLAQYGHCLRTRFALVPMTRPIWIVSLSLSLLRTASLSLSSFLLFRTHETIFCTTYVQRRRTYRAAHAAKFDFSI